MRGLSIAHLDLCGRAHLAAVELQRMVPDVVFASGRRTLDEQAHAMAVHVAMSRTWIAATYRPSAASVACQAWVDAHPLVEDVGR